MLAVEDETMRENVGQCIVAYTGALPDTCLVDDNKITTRYEPWDATFNTRHVSYRPGRISVDASFHMRL